MFGWIKRFFNQKPDKASPLSEVPSYPKELNTFFEAGACPDCGNLKFHQKEDGGHDVHLTCSNCSSTFGVQSAPFNMIERVQKIKQTTRKKR